MPSPTARPKAARLRLRARPPRTRTRTRIPTRVRAKTMEIKTIDELLELELDEMTFDEVFEAFFTTDDDDTEYRACTYSGRPMHRELFGSDPGSWGVIIPTWAEINQRVVLAPICYTTQGAYQLAGWRL